MVRIWFVLVLVAVIHCFHDNLVRRTKYGLVRGQLKTSRINTYVTYVSFMSIPYASPPVGNLRFQDPAPHATWTGVKDTTTRPAVCTQMNKWYFSDNVHGSEDCLYLEVSEPVSARNGSNELLPVLVWIHGGAFGFSVDNVTGPDYLMEKPIIVVILQYRLNVFGFLSTNDKHASGNYGLKDQVLALKWIKCNIRFFGGDRNRVTIAGGSASGASVQLHVLSPKSRGLFHRAISQSGTALNIWALQRDPVKVIIKLAQGLGISAKNNADLVGQLRKLDYQVLIRAAFNIFNPFIPYYGHPFLPTIEGNGRTAFITERAFSALETGQYPRVPYMMGYASEEGSYAYLYIVNRKVDIGLYQDRPELLVPRSMNIRDNCSCQTSTLNAIKTHYFKDGSVTDKTNWINFMSQELFVRGIIKSAEMSNKTNLYFYTFTYNGTRSLANNGGVGHYREIMYLFYPTNDWGNVESATDTIVRHRMVRMWTNFASTGNPTPYLDPLLQNVIWPKFYTNESFLDIGEQLRIQQHPNKKDSIFWNEIFEKCGQKPFYTF